MTQLITLRPEPIRLGPKKNAPTLEPFEAPVGWWARNARTYARTVMPVEEFKLNALERWKVGVVLNIARKRGADKATCKALCTHEGGEDALRLLVSDLDTANGDEFARAVASALAEHEGVTPEDDDGARHFAPAADKTPDELALEELRFALEHDRYRDVLSGVARVTTAERSKQALYEQARLILAGELP